MIGQQLKQRCECSRAKSIVIMRQSDNIRCSLLQMLDIASLPQPRTMVPIAKLFAPPLRELTSFSVVSSGEPSPIKTSQGGGNC